VDMNKKCQQICKQYNFMNPGWGQNFLRGEGAGTDFVQS